MHQCWFLFYFWFLYIYKNQIYFLPWIENKTHNYRITKFHSFFSNWAAVIKLALTHYHLFFIYVNGFWEFVASHILGSRHQLVWNRMNHRRYGLPLALILKTEINLFPFSACWLPCDTISLVIRITPKLQLTLIERPW